VSKYHQVSRYGAANCGIGTMCWWQCSQLDVQLPKCCDGSAVSLQDDCVVVFDCDMFSSEGNIAAGIAELSNGQQWLGCQLWDHMSMSCHKWQSW